MADGDEPGVSTHAITMTKVRLGALTGPKDAWRFEPIPEGALALVLCTSDAQPSKLRAARVGERGLLYEIVAPHDNVSSTADALMYLVAPHQYQVWWTLDEEQYAETLHDPTRLFEEGVFIRVEQYRWIEHAPLMSNCRSSTVTWVAGRSTTRSVITSCTDTCSTRARLNRSLTLRRGASARFSRSRSCSGTY